MVGRKGRRIGGQNRMLNILRTEGEEKRYRGRRTKRRREVFEKKEAEGSEEEKHKFAVLFPYAYPSQCFILKRFHELQNKHQTFPIHWYRPAEM